MQGYDWVFTSSVMEWRLDEERGAQREPGVKPRMQDRESEAQNGHKADRERG